MFVDDMNALFIGRFQPFHYGHLHVIKTILAEYDHVIIGVGSSQYENTPDNPFSYNERDVMITKTLHAEKITRFTVVPLPDIHDPPRWVDHVVTLVPTFSVVFTNNSFTASLFTEKKYTVKQPGFYQKQKYSGEQIRRAMTNHESWKDFVHPAIHDFLKEINAEKRVSSLNQ